MSVGRHVRRCPTIGPVLDRAEPSSGETPREPSRRGNARWRGPRIRAARCCRRDCRIPLHQSLGVVDPHRQPRAGRRRPRAAPARGDRSQRAAPGRRSPGAAHLRAGWGLRLPAAGAVYRGDSRAARTARARLGADRPQPRLRAAARRRLLSDRQARLRTRRGAVRGDLRPCLADGHAALSRSSDRRAAGCNRRDRNLGPAGVRRLPRPQAGRAGGGADRARDAGQDARTAVPRRPDRGDADPRRLARGPQPGAARRRRARGRRPLLPSPSATSTST